jgi:hypothetical protein
MLTRYIRKVTVILEGFVVNPENEVLTNRILVAEMPPSLRTLHYQGLSRRNGTPRQWTSGVTYRARERGGLQLVQRLAGRAAICRA